MGSVIALTNQKGGVGKTTLAVNLVACLSDVWMKTDRKILLIDTDIQANATFLLSKESYSYRDTIGALFQDEILPSGRRLVHETGRKNLFLVPSSPQMAAEEQRIPFRERRGERLSLFLKEVGDDYDLVLIDCPPALNIFVLNAFFASDSILVPMPPEELAVQGFEQLMGQIAAVRSVARGERFLSPDVAHNFAASAISHSSSDLDPPLALLGRRERQVLALLAQGLRSHEIAVQMGIAPSTVEVHRRNIRQKLGLSSIAELTRYALRKKIISG